MTQKVLVYSNAQGTFYICNMSHTLYALGDRLWMGSKPAVASRISRLGGIRAFLGLGQHPLVYPNVWNIPLCYPPPLDKIYRHIDQKRPQGLLIFSDNGVSGAPEIVAGQLMRERQMTMQEALEFISQQHPEIRPNPDLIQDVEKWVELNNFLRGSNDALWLQ